MRRVFAFIIYTVITSIIITLVSNALGVHLEGESISQGVYIVMQQLSGIGIYLILFRKK